MFCEHLLKSFLKPLSYDLSPPKLREILQYSYSYIIYVFIFYVVSYMNGYKVRTKRYGEL